VNIFICGVNYCIHSAKIRNNSNYPKFFAIFYQFPPHFPENHTPAPHADPQRISLIELAKMQFAKDSLLQGER
jgi:hypothetical protein